MAHLGNTVINGAVRVLGGSYSDSLTLTGAITFAGSTNQTITPNGSGILTVSGTLNAATLQKNGTAVATSSDISTLQSNFQAGVDSVYNAIVAQGTTPASKSLSDVVTGIGTLSTNRYNAGTTAGYNTKRNQLTGTYTPTGTGGSKLDMGSNHSSRYVNTNTVYNTGTTNGYNAKKNALTGTYTPTGSGGSKLDMGADHTQRYVNTNTVYNTGTADGYTAKRNQLTGTFTPTSNNSKHDMGSNHNTRYVNTNTVYNAGTAAGYNSGTTAGYNSKVSQLTGTFTPSSNNSKHDMGSNHSSRYVNTNTVYNAGTSAGYTAKRNQLTGTYTPTSRSSKLDMGSNHSSRYVNTNSVPNSNSGTYHAHRFYGTFDLGAANSYRYLYQEIGAEPISSEMLFGYQTQFTAKAGKSYMIFCSDGSGNKCTITGNNVIINFLVGGGALTRPDHVALVINESTSNSNVTITYGTMPFVCSIICLDNYDG